MSKSITENEGKNETTTQAKIVTSLSHRTKQFFRLPTPNYIRTPVTQTKENALLKSRKKINLITAKI